MIPRREGKEGEEKKERKNVNGRILGENKTRVVVIHLINEARAMPTRCRLTIFDHLLHFESCFTM